jgi:hypothetical protein
VTGLASLSTGGPGCVPLTRDWVEAAADLAVPASGGHRTGSACPPQKAVREAASRLFHQPHASASRAAVRATLDRTTGSEPNGSGPTGAGWLPSQIDTNRSTPLDVMAGLGPATSCGPHRRQDVDPRIKSGDDGEGAGIAAVEIPDRTTGEALRALSPLWGRVGEGGAAPDWNQQSASPLPGPPPQGGRGTAPHSSGDLVSRFARPE